MLRRYRPRARYLGVDGSPYAVERFGRRRHIVLGEVRDGGTDAGYPASHHATSPRWRQVVHVSIGALPDTEFRPPQHGHTA